MKILHTKGIINTRFKASGLQIRQNKAKSVILLLISLFIGNLAFCQTSKLYKCKDIYNKGFLCISDDTLSFFSTRGGYYYGKYFLQDSIIIPYNNLMDDRSCTIIEEPCDSSCLEIALCFWEHPLFTPFDENYESRLFIDTALRIFVCYDNLQNKASGKNGIVSFCNDELNNFGDSLTFHLYIDGYTIRAKATIPVKAGVRYWLMQKQYKMYPWIKDAPWFNPLIYYKKNKQQIVFYYGEKFSLTYDLEGDCDSCLEELRKQFPKL